MHEIGKELYFSYGHRLMNHAGKCRMLHGHNAKVTIKLACQNLNEDGMVIDFSEIKNAAKSWLDEQFDHQMLLYEDDPVVEVLKNCGEHIRVLNVHPTAECLAKLIFDFIQSKNFPVTEVTLWESESCFATYRI